MGLFGNGSIEQPKKSLFAESETLKELAAQQGAISESASTIADNLGSLGGLLDSCIQLLNGTKDITSTARGQQKAVARGTDEQIKRLSHTAAGTDNQGLLQAARALNAEQDNIKGHEDNLVGLDEFAATALSALTNLVDQLHKQPGSLTTAQGLPEGMNNSAGVLRKAAEAAGAHAPTM